MRQKGVLADGESANGRPPLSPAADAALVVRSWLPDLNIREAAVVMAVHRVEDPAYTYELLLALRNL